MSMEQFKKFFWPTLRELMVALIHEGLTPCPLWEGNCTSRLEVIKDIPAGKACYAFEATDLVKAKEILGDTVCIRGNVPLSILATGTPDDVRTCCKKLIDTVGRRAADISWTLPPGLTMPNRRMCGPCLISPGNTGCIEVLFGVNRSEFGEINFPDSGPLCCPTKHENHPPPSPSPSEGEKG